MKLKNLTTVFLLLTLLNNGYSQITVYLNGSSIKASTTVNLSEVKTLSAKFTNAKKIDGFINGICVFYAKINDVKESCTFYYKTTEGTTSVKDFMYTSKPEQFLISNESGKTTLTSSGCYTSDGWRYLTSYISDQKKKNAITEVLKIEFGFYYKESIGYEKLGSAIDLLTPVVIYLDANK